jgi:hypothetical protein
MAHWVRKGQTELGASDQKRFGLNSPWNQVHASNGFRFWRSMDGGFISLG